MKGLINVIQMIVDNWTLIMTAIIIVCTGIIQLKDFFKKTKEERVEIAKKQIKECIMDYICRAEIDYSDMIKAGSVKRAQVIKEIFTQYPELNKLTDQDSLITWIDETIDEGLEELREIISKNENSFVIMTKEGE